MDRRMRRGDKDTESIRAIHPRGSSRARTCLVRSRVLRKPGKAKQHRVTVGCCGYVRATVAAWRHANGENNYELAHNAYHPLSTAATGERRESAVHCSGKG